MKLKFKIVYPSLVSGNICGENLSLMTDSTTYIRIKSPCGGLLDGNNFVALSDIGGLSGSGYVENNKGIMLPVTYDYLGSRIGITIDNFDNIWDFVNLSIEIQAVGYHGYMNIFTIYGYDLGYITTCANNYPFEIIMIRDNYGTPPEHKHLAYSSFIAYRVPFTDKIRIYNNNSAALDGCYYKDENGNDLLNARDGYICHADTVRIVQYCSVQGTTCSSYIDMPSIKWFPDYQLEVDCNTSCVEQCQFVPDSTGKAIPNLDFSNCPNFSINAVDDIPAIINLGIDIDLIDSAGSVLESFKRVYNRYNTTNGIELYNNTNFEYSFQVTKGDFGLKLCLKVLGEYVEVLQGDDIVVGDWYEIVNNRTGDFVGVGAADNNIGTQFQATGTTPTYGIYGRLLRIINGIEDPLDLNGWLTDGIQPNLYYQLISLNLGNADYSSCALPMPQSLKLEAWHSTGDEPVSWGTDTTVASDLVLIKEVYQCCSITTISGCDIFETTQTSCNSYTLYNNSLEEITVYVYQMNDTGTFEELTTITIDPLSNETLTLTEQGVYTINTTISQAEITHIIISVCDVMECLLAKIKTLNCTCTEPCKDKDWYEFNAVMLQLGVFYNIVNKYLNINYSFTVLDETQVSELFKLSQIISRFEVYCETCNKPCNCGQS